MERKLSERNFPKFGYSTRGCSPLEIFENDVLFATGRFG